MLIGGERAPDFSPPDPPSPGKYEGLPPLKLPLINKHLPPPTYTYLIPDMVPISGTRYQVPGTSRYQVPGTSRYQVPGTSYRVPGTKYQAPSARYLAIRYQVRVPSSIRGAKG